MADEVLLTFADEQSEFFETFLIFREEFFLEIIKERMFLDVCIKRRWNAKYTRFDVWLLTTQKLR